MKNLFLIATAATMLFACSKNDPASSGDGDLHLENKQVFDLSAVNRLSTGLAKSSVYSSEAISTPVYLPALNVENLTLTGGWSPVTQY